MKAVRDTRRILLLVVSPLDLQTFYNKCVTRNKTTEFSNLQIIIFFSFNRVRIIGWYFSEPSDRFFLLSFDSVTLFYIISWIKIIQITDIIKMAYFDCILRTWRFPINHNVRFNVICVIYPPHMFFSWTKLSVKVNK